MYTPRSYRNQDLPRLHQLIADYSFGVLTSPGNDGPMATHLPFMIDPDRGPNGTLVAHMARANPHWKSWRPDSLVLVVFQGPHAYISPAWYENQETVPTWNYAAVHAYGRPRLVEGEGEMREMLLRLIDTNEAAIGRPWDTTLAAVELETSIKSIVGFEIPIDRIEGKFKFNQNRSQADQRGVVAALEQAGGDMNQLVIEIMRRTLDGGGSD